jgi:hypothetical protein
MFDLENFWSFVTVQYCIIKEGGKPPELGKRMHLDSEHLNPFVVILSDDVFFR